MTVILQKFRITLEALSPVFIGGGEDAQLSPYTDFVRKGNQIVIIDQRKFQAALAENLPLVDELVQEIKNRFDNNRSLFSLSDFITNRLKLTISDVEQCRLPVEGDIQTVPIRRFIASAGRAYIPGSTIKGAIRTAVLLDWLLKTNAGKKQLAEIRMFVEKKDLKALKQLDFGKECFGSVARDVFKYLRVSDSALFDDTSLSVSEIKRVSIKEQRGNVQRRRSDIPMWGEALNSGTKSTFTVSLLKPFSLTGFPFLDKQSIAELLHILNAQSRESCERELQELEHAPRDFEPFRKFYEKLLDAINKIGGQEAIVRLGGGKTWFDNSIGFAIDQDDFGPEFLFGAYLKLLRLGNLPFPSTRSAVLKGGLPALPLGWVKLSVEG
jgi:CRISPR-associated protein Csm5